MLDIRETGRNIYFIDDDLYSIPGSGCVYLLAEEQKVLIDSGPATSSELILQAIRDLGYQAEDIDYLILTHIHLDHAGGAGTLLKSMPRAKVVAHHRAIRHLIDPARLVLSALAAQAEGSGSRNGEMLAIPIERLIAVKDGDILKLSEAQTLTFLECPGHAPHELVISESQERGLFVGDAVGHHIPGTELMVPVTPPPSFDLESYVQTLNRLMGLSASRIFFAHCGASDQVQVLLELALRKLLERDKIVADCAAENNLESATEKLFNHICSELAFLKQNRKALYDYWVNVDIRMSAAEHVRYYRKKHGV
jgi:glyoxylase-like metal-dependent hydrolase (beta-lactamase superfamily II)